MLVPAIPLRCTRASEEPGSVFAPERAGEAQETVENVHHAHMLTLAQPAEDYVLEEHERELQAFRRGERRTGIKR